MQDGVGMRGLSRRGTPLTCWHLHSFVDLLVYIIRKGKVDARVLNSHANIPKNWACRTSYILLCQGKPAQQLRL